SILIVPPSVQPEHVESNCAETSNVTTSAIASATPNTKTHPAAASATRLSFDFIETSLKKASAESDATAKEFFLIEDPVQLLIFGQTHKNHLLKLFQSRNLQDNALHSSSWRFCCPGAPKWTKNVLKRNPNSALPNLRPDWFKDFWR